MHIPSANQLKNFSDRKFTLPIEQSGFFCALSTELDIEMVGKYRFSPSIFGIIAFFLVFFFKILYDNNNIIEKKIGGTEC